MLLFDAMRAKQTIGEKWSNYFMHPFTLRNALFCVANLAMRVVNHPPGTPFAPDKTMEDASEQHFAQKKAGGLVPTVATCVYNTQKCHLRQWLHPWVPKERPLATKMQEEEAAKIMTRAFCVASKLECICSVNKTAESSRAQLMKRLAGN